MPYFKMNGRDIARFIEMNGIQESENDLDSPKAGRTLNTRMDRDKLGQKLRNDIKLVFVRKADLDWIFPILRNEYFRLETDLIPGYPYVNTEVYNSTRKSGLACVDINGVPWYTGTSFNIIER